MIHERFIKIKQILLHFDSLETKKKWKEAIENNVATIVKPVEFSRFEKINQSKSRFGLLFLRSTAI